MARKAPVLEKSVMPSAIEFVPISVYLKSVYEPDAEYVDGEIEERPSGEDDHSAWQAAISFWFRQHAKEWGVRVRPGIRVRTLPTRFRVPDVIILDRARPTEKIATRPPVAVFEVLSPEDTVRRLMRKLNDYSAMGISEFWVVDPEARIFSRFEDGQLIRRTDFFVPSKSISFPINQIEAMLD